MKGELYINGEDAYATWGISMDETSLSALMTPAPNKGYIENKSILENGKRVDYSKRKKDERDLTLQINLTASNEKEFFDRYNRFCKQLDKGVLSIITKYQNGVVYNTVYISCQQFSQFMRGVGKFVLKLNEPDPTDRSRIW